ncbi:hypothetical protein IQ247_09775 [Plectonema cf. radiosum LEGE 06105]|uniref:Uncharacterized protein n=1 Tax=Plectonema cf. radiosum LEGE 06105 TaxID=945769 RepID=A0A8J7F1J3_9CYAN|nr:hypothetical protein [Plectonema radiosum]MBE9212970.1 hypothetical protein [Plectonema cf. radiosum LEGE 06105]
MKHKNHVSSKAKTIRKEMQRKFGISEGDIVRALKGDERAAKHIAQMGIDGRRLSKYAPQLADNMIDSIQGTDALNKMWADVYQQVGKSSLAIESDIARTELADDDLNDGRTEKAFKFIQDKQLRADKHSDNMQALQMEAEIADIEQMANHEYRMQKLENKLPLKQMQADRDYKEQRLDHILQNGDASQLELVPEKRYTERSLLSRVVDFFKGK